MAFNSPHPPAHTVDVATFDYRTYAFQHVKADLDGDGVLLITLDRPQQLNAYSAEMTYSLIFLYSLASVDPRVKAIVLTGSGKAFCAGADLSGSGFGVNQTAPDPIGMHRDGGGQLVLAMLNCRKVIVAAINGNAVGIGFTMCLPADLRVCADNAKLGVPFAKRGIPCDALSSSLLPRLIGNSAALNVLITGSLHPPTSPLLSQLYHTITPPTSVLPTAMALAKKLVTENSLSSMALIKAQVWRPLQSLEETHLMESKALAWTVLHGDAKEGVNSFLEKRNPRFQSHLGSLASASFYPWWNPIDTSSNPSSSPSSSPSPSPSPSTAMAPKPKL